MNELKSITIWKKDNEDTIPTFTTSFNGNHNEINKMQDMVKWKHISPVEIRRIEDIISHGDPYIRVSVDEVANWIIERCIGKDYYCNEIRNWSTGSVIAAIRESLHHL
ncbi:MAG: hypothetical protein KAI88_05175 [Nitrosomonadaceae bacterium]|nr:hypothetical protein [Nitrosomonadaceae bacterium]